MYKLKHSINQHFQHIMLFIYKKKCRNFTQTQNKLTKDDVYTVYGEGSVNVSKWFAKLYAGDFSLNDSLYSARSVDNDLIKILLENNEHYKTQEPKYPNKGLKIIHISLVMLVALTFGFCISKWN